MSRRGSVLAQMNMQGLKFAVFHISKGYKVLRSTSSVSIGILNKFLSSTDSVFFVLQYNIL
jgi:hypothetical protein